MLNSMILLIVSIILIGLATTLIILFIKYIKTMNILTEELRKEQAVLYKEIKSNLDVKNQQESEIKPVIRQNNKNLNTTTLKSSKVSQQELLELIKDKEPVFKKEVTIQPEGGFTNLNIDISNKTKIQSIISNKYLQKKYNVY